MLSGELSKIRHLLCSRNIAVLVRTHCQSNAENVALNPLPFPLFI